MLSNKAGKVLIEYIADYVIFDLETTGVSCNDDEVVEISAIKVRGGKPVDEFSELVNPGRPIPYSASKIHGITDDMVSTCPIFQEVLIRFIDFTEDDVLVGHNIRSFDMKFLQRSLLKYFGKQLSNDYIDTLQIARIFLPDLDHHSLVDVAKYYGIETDGAHRAINDCRMNQKIFECLKKEIENPSEKAKMVQRCPKCGNALKRRTGRFGEFFGCMSYPDCRYTRNV